METVDLLIGGESRDARNGAMFERSNPITGKVVSWAAAATLEDADDAVAAAHSAFPAWAKLGPGERRATLMRAADLLEQRTDRFIALGVDETGAAANWHGFT